MMRIFLSYAREDDGEPLDRVASFLWRLHQDLQAAGFVVWYDQTTMPMRNLSFDEEIRIAVAACDRLVLVVGPGAASSDYVRGEWQFAYYKADKVVVPILRWGDFDLLPEELRELHCEDFREEPFYSFHLKRLIRNLREPEPALGPLHGVPSLPEPFLARTDRLKHLLTALRTKLADSAAPRSAGACVGLHGMGGSGKSVLASMAARDRRTRQSFPAGVVWIGLGPTPTVVERMREMHRDLGGDGDFQTEARGRTLLRGLLKKRSVLLVLDDAWRREDLDWFRVLGPRCRVLITTRLRGLLASLGCSHQAVDLLTEVEGLDLLNQAVGPELELQPEKAAQLLAECGRLPLAVALAGGMIRQGTPVADALDALREHELEFLGDPHAANKNHRDLWRMLEVSGRALEPKSRRLLAELAVFPAAESIPEPAIVTLWGHTGGLTGRGARKLLIHLRQRSLLRLVSSDGVETQQPHLWSIHELIHDYCVRLARRQLGSDEALHERLLRAYAEQCPAGWATGPRDGYFLTHLRHHLIAAGRGGELADLAGDLDWLEAKATTELFTDLLADLDQAARLLPESPFHRDILAWLTPRLATYSRHPDCLRNEVANEFLPAAGRIERGRRLADQLDATPPLIERARDAAQRPVYLCYPHGTAKHGATLLRVARDAPIAVLGDPSGAVSAWEMTTGRLLRFWQLQTEPLGLVVSADGSRVAVRGTGGVAVLLSTGTVRQGDTPDWMRRDPLRPPEGDEGCTPIGATPGGETIVTAWRGSRIVAWDWHSGRLQNVWGLPSGETVLDYAVSRSHVLVATSRGRGLQFEIGSDAAGEELFSVADGSVSGVAASLDGEIAAWAVTGPEALARQEPFQTGNPWFRPHDLLISRGQSTTPIDEVGGPCKLWMDEAGEYLVASRHDFVQLHSIPLALARGMQQAAYGSRSGGRFGRFRGRWGCAPDASLLLYSAAGGHSFLYALRGPLEGARPVPFPSEEAQGNEGLLLAAGAAGSHAAWRDRDRSVLHFWTRGSAGHVECEVAKSYSPHRQVSRDGRVVLTAFLKNHRKQSLQVTDTRTGAWGRETFEHGHDIFDHERISSGGGLIAAARPDSSDDSIQVFRTPSRPGQKLALVGKISPDLDDARVGHWETLCVDETRHALWVFWHQNRADFPVGLARWDVDDLDRPPLLTPLNSSEKLSGEARGIARGGRLAFASVGGGEARLLAFRAGRVERRARYSLPIPPAPGYVERLSVDLDSRGRYCLVAYRSFEEEPGSLLWVVDLQEGRTCNTDAAAWQPTGAAAVAGDGAILASVSENAVAVWRTDFTDASITLYSGFWIDHPTDVTFVDRRSLVVLTAYGETFRYAVREA